MKEKLTTVFGAPVADNNNSMTAGPKGPMLMQDVWYLEKMAHFDREVIPERRMHAKGSGAFGTFTVTHDITKYTKAKIFSQIGKKTEMFARFSTVAGERGAADAERDIRGFALKFYTEEGNWDLAGNNTPVFFLRDPLKFPDLNHAVKRDPKTNMRSATNNWDFWTNLPEALHQVTITMSDRGIPFSYRHMHGFGSHTFSFINAENKRNWVKFHFVTQQGIKNLTDAQAQELVGKMGVSQKYRGKLETVITNYAKDLEDDLRNARPERVFITHSGCDEAVIQSVKSYLVSLNIFEEILVTRAGGVISSHCGKGTLGVLFISK